MNWRRKFWDFDGWPLGADVKWVAAINDPPWRGERSEDSKRTSIDKVTSELIMSGSLPMAISFGLKEVVIHPTPFWLSHFGSYFPFVWLLRFCYVSSSWYPGFQRFLPLGELGPKIRAAGGEAEPRRETSGNKCRWPHFHATMIDSWRYVAALWINSPGWINSVVQFLILSPGFSFIRGFNRGSIERLSPRLRLAPRPRRPYFRSQLSESEKPLEPRVSSWQTAKKTPDICGIQAHTSMRESVSSPRKCYKRASSGRKSGTCCFP